MILMIPVFSINSRSSRFSRGSDSAPTGFHHLRTARKKLSARWNGDHTYLAFFLAIATALTVFIISYTYSRIIEHFPHGGGGYIVASHMLGKRAGVISGSALIVDYILTITVSITACVEALFSYLPLNISNSNYNCCLS